MSVDFVVAGAFGERKWRAAASGYRASFWNDENIMELDGGGGFPGGSDGKESACNVGDLGSIPGLEYPLEGGHGNPLQYSCLENPYEQRSLAGYSPWGCKESDTVKRPST